MTDELQPISPIQSYLERLHQQHAPVRDGAVADYIPELSRANPDWFGICLATRDGHVYEVGDTGQPFTIQSISKPFTYGIALEDRGLDTVLRKMSVEPTGDAFNSISLTPEGGRPYNPMINAGAIATTGLVNGTTHEEKIRRIVSAFENYTGRPLTIDEKTYRSESLTGHRNRAIGWMLRNSEVLESDPGETVEAYFEQCSIEVTCRDLALMGATLANNGRNPVTGATCLDPRYVPHVLSVMGTCGMYDYAGQWMYWVGLPAKSGVGGGIVAVLPGRLAIGVFSPLLDARGNSVRGTAVCRDLSERFNLHLFKTSAMTTPIRSALDATRVRSKRQRTAAEDAKLRSAGGRIRVFVCQGEMNFPSAEIVLRRVMESANDAAFAVIDFERVLDIDEGASRLFLDLVEALSQRGTCTPVFASTRAIPALQQQIEAGPDLGLKARFLHFDSRDLALEWCENQILGEGGKTAAATVATLAGQELCQGMSPAALGQLQARLERHHFTPGETIVRRGEPADRLYFLIGGEVRVVLKLPSGQTKRLATFAPGMAFGEIALVDRSTRTADVVADGEVECLSLGVNAFDELVASSPEFGNALLSNLVRILSRRLRAANEEIEALAG